MELNRRTLIAAGAGIGLIPQASHAQIAPREETWEERWRRGLIEDFAGLRVYAAQNRELKANGRKVDIVFMGDSITDGWKAKRPDFFTPGRISRGIGGQTTPQMVLRMMADVVAHKPRFVHIMAGTNDIAGNTGPMTIAQTADNIRVMTTIAKAHGIKVLLASVPPARGFPWRPGLDTVAPIREVNRWAQGFAREAKLTWVDYTPALADDSGAMKPGMAYDGVHPDVQGYAAMEAVLTPLLKARKA